MKNVKVTFVEALIMGATVIAGLFAAAVVGSIFS